MEKSSLAKILNCHPEMGSKVEHTLTLSIRLGQLETRKEKTKYQLVKLNGHYKRFIPIPNGEDFDTKCIFVCIGRLLDSDLLRDMSMVVDSGSNAEFCSKQSMEWKFVYVDDRAPSIIGYSSFELLGNSGYDYVHVEDLEKLAAGHEQLMRNGIGTSCYHRFLTKGQQWIWLQSRYRITINRRTSAPESVSCIHRVVSYVEVMKDLRNKSASSPTGFNLSKVEVSEPAPHRRNSSPLNIGNIHTPPTTMINSSTPAPMRSMNNLDPMLAPYIQTSMSTTSARQPVAFPVAAFYLNPIPTNSASTLVGYSSGILLAPSFQEQLLLNQAGPQSHMVQHQAEQFRRASEPIDVRQSYLFENGQPIPNQRICQPSHANSDIGPYQSSEIGYTPQSYPPM